MIHSPLAAPKSHKDVAISLWWLSEHMLDIATSMEYYGGFSEMAKHGKELALAAMVCAEWSHEIERGMDMSIRSIIEEQISSGIECWQDIPAEVFAEILETKGFDEKRHGRMCAEMIRIINEHKKWDSLTEDERDEIYADNGFNISFMYEMIEVRTAIRMQVDELFDEIAGDGYVGREHTLIVDRKSE